MTPEDVLSHPPRILTQAQRESYFETGYVCVEGLIPAATVAQLNDVTSTFIDRSRGEAESGAIFDLAPGHGRERPRVRRIKKPDEQHALYWDYAKGVIADVAADLVGPNVVFHHSKLNFKWHDGGDEVKWHQDIQFYPHTNYSPLTIGTYLIDTGLENGALAVLPGSQDGPLHDQYDGTGEWAGCLADDAAASLATEDAVYLTGPAGSITVHNCRTVHGSPPSQADDGRPLLLNAYTAADALAYTPHPDPSKHSYEIVRGERVRWAHHDPRPCQIPPDWSGGYSSIFAAQAGENA